MLARKPSNVGHIDTRQVADVPRALRFRPHSGDPTDARNAESGVALGVPEPKRASYILPARVDVTRPPHLDLFSVAASGAQLDHFRNSFNES